MCKRSTMFTRFSPTSLLFFGRRMNSSRLTLRWLLGRSSPRCFVKVEILNNGLLKLTLCHRRSTSTPPGDACAGLWLGRPPRLRLQVIPQIFSWTDVWALRPVKDFHIFVVKSLQCRFGSRLESCWRRNMLALLSGLWQTQTRSS